MESKSRQLSSEALETASTPRLLLDARKLGQGGIGVYLENLIVALLEQNAVELSLLTSQEKLDSYPWRREVRVVQEEARLYSLDEMFRLPKRIPWSNFDLFHVPHYTLPFGVPIPSIITVHDIIHVTHPERWYYPLAAKALIRSALRRATRVVVVSEASRAALEKLIGPQDVCCKKISVIPNSIPQAFTKDTQRCCTKGRYILCVCSQSKPHKGVEDLVEAFSDLQRDLWIDRKGAVQPYPLRLLLVGQGTADERLQRALRVVPGVEVLGSVDTEKLRELYEGALALVVPSKAEGSSLPVLEAKALGTRIISRPVPAVLELLSQNDLVCEDFSIGALKNAMRFFVESEVLEENSRVDPPQLAWLERHSHSVLAGRTLDVYFGALQQDREP